MNTGVGDAFDLSWKLAGDDQRLGWPGLLDGYEQERRPIGIRNVAAAGWAAAGVPIWRALVTPAVYDDTPEGEAMRRSWRHRSTSITGGCTAWSGWRPNYSYAGSPLIADEPGNAAEWETSRYEPHARPGVRIPHMWLNDGRALQDVLGNDYTLLDLRGDCDAHRLRRRSARSALHWRFCISMRRGCARSMVLRSSCCGRTCISPGVATARRPIPSALAAMATGHLTVPTVSP